MAGGDGHGRGSWGGHGEMAAYSVGRWGLESTAGQWARCSECPLARGCDHEDSSGGKG